MNEKHLEMTFDPNTIQHLGIKMYSQIPTALTELIANAYDADATKVKVSLCDESGEKKIIVQDNGHGMNFKDINEKFLKIGRNRREEGENLTLKKRIPSGKKGLGKLALFGICEDVKIETKIKGEKQAVSFSLDWQDIKEETGAYTPKHREVRRATTDHGTTVTISGILRKSPFNIKELATSLAKNFVNFGTDFVTTITYKEDAIVLDNDHFRFQFLEDKIEFEWNVANIDIDEDTNNYIKKNKIHGKIVTTEFPLPSGLKGITLYANGRLVNAPEFFGASESSHFYTYATGSLHVNFIDKSHGYDDLISTNRQSLNWDAPLCEELRTRSSAILRYLKKEWSERRKKEDKKKIEEKIGISIKNWINTMPEEKAETIIGLVKNVSEDNQTLKKTTVMEAIFNLVPSYPELHWRFLHKSLTSNEAVKRHYTNKDYFKAVDEAVKIYTQEVQEISNQSHDGRKLIKNVFGSEKDPIKLTNRSNLSEKNIEDGHRDLSLGVMSGFRNVIAHETETELKDYFNETDCLACLSLISHLLDRLDRRPKDSGI